MRSYDEIYDQALKDCRTELKIGLDTLPDKCTYMFMRVYEDSGNSVDEIVDNLEGYELRTAMGQVIRTIKKQEQE